MSYAVFKTGGKQYRVATGETLKVEKLDGETGSRVEFKEVLAVGEGENLKVGKLDGATVTAEIIGQVKADKVLAYKYRRRKGYHRTVGHRQKLTEVKITEISA
jgi:large subunit ribosomal protein L21